MGFFGSLAKCALGVAALPLVAGGAVVMGAVEVVDKAAPLAGKAAKAAGKATLNALADANEVRKNSADMSDAELRNAYNSTTSATKRAGYAAAMKERYES